MRSGGEPRPARLVSEAELERFLGGDHPLMDVFDELASDTAWAGSPPPAIEEQIRAAAQGALEARVVVGDSPLGVRAPLRPTPFGTLAAASTPTEGERRRAAPGAAGRSPPGESQGRAPAGQPTAAVLPPQAKVAPARRRPPSNYAGQRLAAGLAVGLGAGAVALLGLHRYDLLHPPGAAESSTDGRPEAVDRATDMGPAPAPIPSAAPPVKTRSGATPGSQAAPIPNPIPAPTKPALAGPGPASAHPQRRLPSPPVQAPGVRADVTVAERSPEKAFLPARDKVLSTARDLADERRSVGSSSSATTPSTPVGVVARPPPPPLAPTPQRAPPAGARSGAEGSAPVAFPRPPAGVAEVVNGAGVVASRPAPPVPALNRARSTPNDGFFQPPAAPNSGATGKTRTRVAPARVTSPAPATTGAAVDNVYFEDTATPSPAAPAPDAFPPPDALASAREETFARVRRLLAKGRPDDAARVLEDWVNARRGAAGLPDDLARFRRQHAASKAGSGGNGEDVER